MTTAEKLEQAKTALIERYLKMQDEADALNRRIYEITVEIEALNIQIKQAKAAETRRVAAT